MFVHINFVYNQIVEFQEILKLIASIWEKQF
jgi:hypothetical protein